MMKFVIFRDVAGYYRWHLLAENGLKVATSGEAFASKQNAIRSAYLVKQLAANASVFEA